MPYPLIIASILLVAFGVAATLLSTQRKKAKKLNAELASIQKNHDYLIYLIRDLQDIYGYGNDLSNIVDVITKSLESTYPYSTISSAFVREQKIVFKAQVKESVSHAFVNHIKDTLVAAITESGSQRPEGVEENITGVALDDLGKSEIKSTVDIKLTINFQTHAVINISSTSENIYTEGDEKTLSMVSYLVSGFLTRLGLLLTFEKSKALAMIDSFSDGIFMIDIDGKVLAMNDASQNFLNVHQQIPRLEDILSVLPNTYNFKQKIESSMRENQPIEENDITINGHVFKVVITPVHEINTKNKIAKDQQIVIGASILLHDVTLEKSLSQMKEDFTNVIVHELRSPLTAIKASSDFLISQADLTPEEKKRLTEMVSESARKMLDKIALILDSAKMDAGLFAIRKTDSDLKKLIVNRVTVFTPLAVEKGISLNVNVDPNIPVFSFDPTRIDEVVNNLLSNSLKFTPEHGTITIQAILEQDKVLVSISDTGEGIAKDKQDKLFAKFQQAPSDSDSVGTGLGLYVVKEVVEKHGGTVSLDSDVGRGTTITFTLPLHALTILPNLTPISSDKTQRLVN